MKSQLKFEMKRKLFHLTAILFIPFYYLINLYTNKAIAIFSLCILLVIFLIIEFFRIKLKKALPIFRAIYRDKEKEGKFSTNIHFTLAAIISFTFFSFPVASTVMLMATLGDMTAAIIGIRFGRHQFFNYSNRTWEGTLSEFVVDLIIATLILNNLILSLAMAFVATLVETTCNDIIDDNLSIPVFAGAIGHFLQKII